MRQSYRSIGASTSAAPPATATGSYNTVILKPEGRSTGAATGSGTHHPNAAESAIARSPDECSPRPEEDKVEDDEESSQVMVDIGANLAHVRFAHDLDAVIQRAKDAKVSRILVTGTSIPASVRAIELAKKYPMTLFATVGVHPHDAKKFDFAKTVPKMRALVLNNIDVVKAIGECGLDFDRNFSSREDQILAFKLQLDLALELNMPLFLHEREAHASFCEVWNEFAQPNASSTLPPACVHCFTGTKRELERYLAMGFYIGITGWICDNRRGAALQDIVHLIPLDRLMIETDAPFLMPPEAKHHRSEGAFGDHRNRNEPSYLVHVASRIAECRGCSVEEVIEATTQTAKTFFRL